MIFSVYVIASSKTSSFKKTKQTGKRGATTIPSLAIFGVDFVEGDETFDETNIVAMVGTYWYDPVDFMKKLIKINKKVWGNPHFF